jgi:hypothetical protein
MNRRRAHGRMVHRVESLFSAWLSANTREGVDRLARLVAMYECESSVSTPLCRNAQYRKAVTQ